ncbi:hypothetical protein J6590_101393, partial [Homalodisca vitripennis]
RQLFVMESVIAKVLLPEPLSVSARLILSYSETLKRCLILAQFLLVSCDLDIQSSVSVAPVPLICKNKYSKDVLFYQVTSEPPPMIGQAGCLQGLDLSAVTHPSSSHARRCLIQLSWDNRCTRYTAPLTLFVLESVIAKVLLPEPLSISARLILSYSETLKRCLILAQFLLVSCDLDIQVESPVSVSRQFPSFVKTSTVKMSYSTRGRAKKPSLTLNLGTNGLKVTYEPPPIVGQAGCLQGLDLSAVTHPSSSHARRCLIQLSWDNCCTRYTAPLTSGSFKLPASIDRQLFVMESVIAKVLLSISARLILETLKRCLILAQYLLRKSCDSQQDLVVVASRLELNPPASREERITRYVTDRSADCRSN